MKINTCKFVRVSNLFTEAPLAWEKFFQYESQFRSYNNNTKLLAKIKDIKQTLVFLKQDSSNIDEVTNQCGLVISRLNKLTNDVFIDLEN